MRIDFAWLTSKEFDFQSWDQWSPVNLVFDADGYLMKAKGWSRH